MSLQLHGLKCGYQFPELVHVPHAELPATGLVGVLGANGAGKTTLLKTMCGLIAPLEGKVLYPQRPLWISTELDWDLQLSVRDIFDLYEVEMSTRFQSLASAYAIAPLLNHRLQNISSGEKRRVALVLALCHRSPILILDEPTNFLEYRARILFAQHLNQLAATKLVIFSTHEVEWLSYLPTAQCWILEANRSVFVCENPQALVENSRLEPIFGGVFRSAERSSSPAQKILYFDPQLEAGIRGKP